MPAGCLQVPTWPRLPPTAFPLRIRPWLPELSGVREKAGEVPSSIQGMSLLASCHRLCLTGAAVCKGRGGCLSWEKESSGLFKIAGGAGESPLGRKLSLRLHFRFCSICCRRRERSSIRTFFRCKRCSSRRTFICRICTNGRYPEPPGSPCSFSLRRKTGRGRGSRAWAFLGRTDIPRFGLSSSVKQPLPLRAYRSSEALLPKASSAQAPAKPNVLPPSRSAIGLQAALTIP